MEVLPGPDLAVPGVGLGEPRWAEKQTLMPGLPLPPSEPEEDLCLHEVQPLPPDPCVLQGFHVGQQVGPVSPGDGSEEHTCSFLHLRMICSSSFSSFNSFASPLPSPAALVASNLPPASPLIQAFQPQPPLFQRTSNASHINPLALKPMRPTSPSLAALV